VGKRTPGKEKTLRQEGRVMAEYIDRIAFRKHIDDFYPFDKEGQKDPKYDFAKGAFLSLLARFTQADVVERKTGKWVHDEFGGNKMSVVKCSECGLKEV
jgi:hypothetical protein